MNRLPITVYTITGRQLFLLVSRKLCEECDLTVNTVRQVVREEGMEDRVEVMVKPWLNNVFRALSVGGWHPPIVVVDGDLYNQGTVPDPGRLRAFLRSRFDGVPVRLDNV